MPTFVVLLRGVNVGKANRVPMAEFRALLSGLGYERVVTLLNSGNAVFSAARGTTKKHAADIAAALKKEMNVGIPVVVKSAAELGAVIAENPFEAGSVDHSRLLVAFSQNREALAALSAIRALVRPPERFAIGKHAAYLLCPAGILKSKAGEALLGRAGGNITTRNLATTLKLHAVACKDDTGIGSGLKPQGATTGLKTTSAGTLKDGDFCTVIGGSHKGKSGTVRDVKTSRTGHVTLTVDQQNGERFKTLGRNVRVQTAAIAEAGG